jgi:hypothetical protein
MTPETVEQVYARHCAGNTAISPHLPRLRALAEGAAVAVEFGVKRGASSSALLMGAAEVVSYDVVATPEARQLETIAGERWQYRVEDSRGANVPGCDLLFIDSLHDYEQCSAELSAHGNKASRYLVFHDTQTFGAVGADGETGKHKWTYVPGRGSVPLNCLGIRQAIDEFMIANPAWRIVAAYPDSHGLLVLQR